MTFALLYRIFLRSKPISFTVCIKIPFSNHYSSSQNWNLHVNERENLRKGTKEEEKKARFPGRSDLVREIIFFSKIFGEQ